MKFRLKNSRNLKQKIVLGFFIFLNCSNKCDFNQKAGIVEFK